MGLVNNEERHKGRSKEPGVVYRKSQYLFVEMRQLLRQLCVAWSIMHYVAG